MNTNYTKEDLERILAKSEARPNDGMKDRLKAIKEMWEKMDQEEKSVENDKADES